MAAELPFYIASSVEELVKEHVEGVEVDKNFSIFHYLATCNNLVKQADIYRFEGDIERTYIYSFRFCIIILEKLPKHPDFNKESFRKSRNEIKRKAEIKLKELEGLKETLKKGYERIKQKKEQERIRIEKEKEKERIFKQERLKLEQEQQLLKEKEEQRNKENLEFENEILRLKEAEDFENRKLQAQKEIKKKTSDRTYELLRQEALLEERKRLQVIENEKKRILAEKQEALEREFQKQILEQQEKERLEKERLEKEEQLRLASLPPPPPDYSSFDSDQLLDLIDNNKKSNTGNNQNVDQLDSGYLLDPSFLPPPPPVIPPQEIKDNDSSNSAPSPQTQLLITQPPHIPNNEKKLPPIYTSTSPIQFGYPSLNSNNNPPSFSLQSPPPPQNNTPFIQQYQQQQQSPPIQSPTNNINKHNIPQYNNYNSKPVSNNLNPLPPQYYQQQHQHQHQLPKLPQYQPVQNNPISANGSAQQPVVNSPPPPTISNKPNIDSSEASKKYSKLRKIIVHGEVFQEFMRLAENNTKRSIETCGILSGTLSNDIFRITTIIIPKQEGTTDTCNTIEEHEIFEYQLENDLLTLGWIHTHPTQDCFLSAVDVHTHCSYQYLLQEAIAVVISPKANPNFGIFRLTDPPGLETVQKCKLKSFHPHPPVNGIPIYTKVDHVDLIWGRKSDSKVVDLRLLKK
ncbi:hypothetical protein RB653_001231 [Dictyostelium firmibasis]|uniref:MPN domain-containing protein n=1 Tax=Dictyostelium firmibasis TaxID=79012 RepID=A0AAN7U4Q2_9MYCE